MCKLVTSMNTVCEISSFSFESKTEVGKLINSMFSLSGIKFSKCDFDFEEDWKIKESRKYAWTMIKFDDWKFTRKTYNSLLRTCLQIIKPHKSGELTIENWDIIDEDSVHYVDVELYSVDQLQKVVSKESNSSSQIHENATNN